VPIVQLDPADTAAMTAWYHLLDAARERDVPDYPPPSWARHMARFTSAWPGQAEEVWLSYVGSDLAGAALIRLPLQENTHMADVMLVVHPQFRRRGIGGQLLDRVYQAARRHGRAILESGVVVGLPGGPARVIDGRAFVQRLGDGPALVNVRRRLTVDDAVMAQQATVIEEIAAHTAGYGTVHWLNRAPDDAVDALAGLESRLVLDAPTGDLDVEPEVYDRQRIRDVEAARDGKGDRCFNTAIRHLASGEIVACTLIAVDADDDEHAWQQLTIVDPAHRGHRLGLLVKATNLGHLHRHLPTIRDIDTWNAATNEHMIAVNDRLGYRVVDGVETWQVPVPPAD
jgi:GNAT superfamily N-acetyltransferase